MQSSIHDVKIDPRNANILISVNGELVPRERAMVSVFDSGFLLGDGVWEGLRVVNGGVPFLREHIERLYEGAKAIFMDIGLSPNDLVQRLFACIDALQLRLQASSAFHLPYQVFLMLPFVLTIVGMALVSRNALAPAALLKPFRKEAR